MQDCCRVVDFRNMHSFSNLFPIIAIQLCHSQPFKGSGSSDRNGGKCAGRVCFSTDHIFTQLLSSTTSPFLRSGSSCSLSHTF